jgi:hypothetical protein
MSNIIKDSRVVCRCGDAHFSKFPKVFRPVATPYICSYPGFTLHIDLGNPACRSADRAKLFHREQTERHQGRGDQKMTMTSQYKDEQTRFTTTPL